MGTGALPAAVRRSFLYRTQGPSAVMWSAPEADSQTFVLGQWVEVVSASAGNASLLNADDEQPFGLVTSAGANNTTNAEISVIAWCPLNIFCIPISQSDAESTDTSAATDVGLVRGVDADTNGYMFMDRETGDGAGEGELQRGIIIGLYDAAGTIGGRVIVQPLANSPQSSG